jgi:hypothetical protein
MRPCHNASLLCFPFFLFQLDPSAVGRKPADRGLHPTIRVEIATAKTANLFDDWKKKTETMHERTTVNQGGQFSPDLIGNVSDDDGFEERGFDVGCI